jgi:hypothetical protein
VAFAAGTPGYRNEQALPTGMAGWVDRHEHAFGTLEVVADLTPEEAEIVRRSISDAST